MTSRSSGHLSTPQRIASSHCCLLSSWLISELSLLAKDTVDYNRMLVFRLTLVIAIACMVVACQVLWFGHTLLARSAACGQAQEATSFLLPPVKQQFQSAQYPASFVKKLARAFPKWQYPELPCVQAEVNWYLPHVLRSPAKEGILFVRNMKTASSTLAGVAIRIARSMARRQSNNNVKGAMCKVRFDHTPAFQLQYGQRNKSKSFLWSFVRDPTNRAVSEFFHFGVSRLKMEPSDANFIKYMIEMRKYTRNYFLLDMTMKPFQPKRDANFTVMKAVESIMKEYDFIGSVERMDESLVAMKMILGLPLNDILYLSAKRNGGWDEGAYEKKCVYIVPSFVSSGMKRFFNSKQWREHTAGDRLLVQAVNISLDMTIDKLGRNEFEAELKQYRKAQVQAQEICGPSTIFPCSAGGERNKDNHTCLWWDSGCGYKCLDQIFKANNSTAVAI